MLTAAARRSLGVVDTVDSPARLMAAGWSERAIRSQVAARRWQRVGRALLLHNADPTWHERAEIALVNHGPRAVLTSFTAGQRFGLAGWERDEIHVLVPGGARVTPLPGVTTHWSGDWRTVRVHQARSLHALGDALVVAAADFASVRPACGILAAGVQQRLVRPDVLRDAVVRAPRTRHRAALIHAMDDIAQGAQALSEIDFVRLCRRQGLPAPSLQAVRVERSGRRRYLDAEWRDRDGVRLVVEVDGAIHLAVSRWVGDQLRQNELVIGGDRVLRFPSVLVRAEDPAVIDQLRRFLKGAT